MVKSPVATLNVTQPTTTTPTPTPTTTPSGLSLSLSASSGAYPSSVTATVTLVNPSTNQPISGATVNLYITNGANGPVSLTTDSSGTATYTFTTPAEGLYLFLAEYNNTFSPPATYMAGFDTMTPPQPLSVVMVQTDDANRTITGQITLKDANGNVVYSKSGKFGLSEFLGGFPPGQYYFSISGTSANPGASDAIQPIVPYTDIPFTLVEGKPTTIAVTVQFTPPASTGTSTLFYFPSSVSGFNDLTVTVTSMTNGETQPLTPRGTLTTIPQGVYVVHYNATDPYWFDVYDVSNTCPPGSPCPIGPVNGSWAFIPMSNPFAWGSSSTSGEYLYTAHWTNPAILARLNLPSPSDNLSITEVQTALPYSQITLSHTPSWGYDRIVYGEDGYIYTIGLGGTPGNFPAVLYKYDPNDISTPIWSVSIPYSALHGGFLFGLIAFGGYVYVSNYIGYIAKFDASTGELVANASGVGGGSITNVFSYNELHTDGTRLWRHVQGGPIYEVDPSTLKVVNQSTQSYSAVTYDSYTGTLFGTYVGNCAKGQTSGCYPAIVDMVDPSTYKVLTEWQDPYLRLGGGTILPTAIAADQDYVFVGFYFYPEASPLPPMLNTGLPRFYADGAPVHVLSITPPSAGTPALTYKGTIYVGVSPAAAGGPSGEKIRRMIALGDGYVYIENDDANAVIFRYRESDWSLQGLIIHPEWYVNIVNSGTPAQPRPDGWEEIRDFAINKWVPS